MHSPSLLVLAVVLLAPAALARTHSKRNHIIRRQAAPVSDPSNLAAGALNVTGGCTEFYTVPEGSYCYLVADEFGLTLEEFYTLNPSVDSLCSNLWADSAYCVSSKPVAAADSTPTLAPVESSSSKASLASANKAAASSFADSGVPTQVKLAAAKPIETTTASPTPSPTPSPEPKPKDTPAPAPAPSPQPAPAPAPSPWTGGSGNALTKAGISGFLGSNTGIASWFRTNAAQDSTNGNSWCGYPYNDDTPGFAPDVTTMLNNFGGDYLKAGPAYCGLEAEFETPDGKKITLFIADGFDSKWVLTPGSIDIVYNHFAKFFGRSTNNKNDVVQGVKWKFTGNRNHDLRFRGYGFT